jgi:HPt (histidine-containing phosphotransfer) domain-containing protein
LWAPKSLRWLVQNGMNKIAKSLAAPIDLQHLSRYTLGGRALEREVLQLFCSQSPLHHERLNNAASPSSWREAAHSLKGAAQAVGAFRVATGRLAGGGALRHGPGRCARILLAGNRSVHC